MGGAVHRTGVGTTPPRIRQRAGYPPAARSGTVEPVPETDHEGDTMTAEPLLTAAHRTAEGHRTEAYPKNARPGFLRAPFSGRTYRGIGYALTSLPLAITGFVVAVTLFSLGVGLLPTVVGLPVLALLTTGARGLGAVERHRVRTLLDTPLPLRRPVATWPARCRRRRRCRSSGR